MVIVWPIFTLLELSCDILYVLFNVDSPPSFCFPVLYFTLDATNIPPSVSIVSIELLVLTNIMFTAGREHPDTRIDSVGAV